MNNSLFIVFVIYGFSSVMNASQDTFAQHKKHQVDRWQENCVLKRAATKSALADHPVLGMFLENIRSTSEADLPETRLSGAYIDQFIETSCKANEFTRQLDRALRENDTHDLEELLRSKSASALSKDSYYERKFLWLMMDSVMIARLREVKQRSVQSILDDIFKCPAIALFAAKQ